MASQIQTACHYKLFDDDANAFISRHSAQDLAQDHKDSMTKSITETAF